MSPAQDRASDHSLSVPVLDPPSMGKPPVADGVVDRYLLNPRGDVNGLLLRDGSQMHVTLRAAQDLTKAVQPGDHIRVHGRRASDSPLVKPDVIINLTDGRSYTVPYRLDLPMPPRELLISPDPTLAQDVFDLLRLRRHLVRTDPPGPPVPQVRPELGCPSKEIVTRFEELVGGA